MNKVILFCTLLILALNHASANCLGDQDLYAEDVNIDNCSELPSSPGSTPMYRPDGTTEYINLGAWELGKTSNGENYKYGSLSYDNPRYLTYAGGSAPVNDLNLECWAKAYYRLKSILLNPPSDYIKLKDAGFQYRFFQFQTDLRNGSTGYRQISSYMDHLVKWVSVIDQNGNCIQPTLGKFEAYLAGEIQRRGL